MLEQQQLLHCHCDLSGFLQVTSCTKGFSFDVEDVAVGRLQICPHAHFKKLSVVQAGLVQSHLSSLSLLFRCLSTFTISSIGSVSNRDCGLGERAGCPMTERLAVQIRLHPSLLLGCYEPKGLQARLAAPCIHQPPISV